MRLRIWHWLLSTLLALTVAIALVPPAHAAGYRWIDVNLSTQRLTAYEGSTPIRTILVTTGRPGYRTPTGTYYIWERLVSTTMTSWGIGIPPDAPGGYDVPDVYYTQYFDSAGDALHANYWTPRADFGRYPTSHGCVGMSTAQAHWLWDWASYGTEVDIHY